MRRQPSIGASLVSGNDTFPGLREDRGRSGVERLLRTVLWSKLVDLRVFKRAE
jgi:hypothetical protein